MRIIINKFSVKQQHVMSIIIFHMIKQMTFLQLLCGGMQNTFLAMTNEKYNNDN